MSQNNPARRMRHGDRPTGPLSWDGESAPAASLSDAPAGLLAEALAVFDLMLEGCNDKEFGDFQNEDGETIGPRMDALHARLRAAAGIERAAAPEGGE